jgi:hypothetical protein
VAIRISLEFLGKENGKSLPGIVSPEKLLNLANLRF